MGFELPLAVAPGVGLSRPDLNFDTLMVEPVADCREPAPGSAPQRTLEKRLVAN